MHHSNFLKATGHQCCLSALYSGYSAGGLQRTHSQAKNTPTLLYTLVDYLIITLRRAKSNFCFTSQVSFLLTHRVSPPPPISNAWVPWQQLGCWGSSALHHMLLPQQIHTCGGILLLLLLPWVHCTHPRWGQDHVKPTGLPGDSNLLACWWIRAVNRDFFYKLRPDEAIATPKAFTATAMPQLLHLPPKPAYVEGCSHTEDCMTPCQESCINHSW